MYVIDSLLCLASELYAPIVIIIVHTFVSRIITTTYYYALTAHREFPLLWWMSFLFSVSLEMWTVFVFLHFYFNPFCNTL